MTTHHADEKKPAQGELSQIAALGRKGDYSGITHFKESGDVYPHDADGWPVGRGNPRGLVDQRDQGRLAGVKKPAAAGWVCYLRCMA